MKAWLPILALLPLVAAAVVTGRLGPALPLVVLGIALVWPLLLARHGRGVALATTVAFGYGTFAWGLALDPRWREAALFLLGSAAARALDRFAPAPGAALRFSIAVAAAAAILVAGGAGPGAMLDGLFAWNGLLSWSPVLWLAVGGCVVDRSPGARVIPPVLLVAAAMGAVTADEAAVRGARFAPVLPLLALGLGRALAALRDLSARRPLAPLAAAVAAFALWNVLLMAEYKGGGVPRDDTVAFARVAGNAAAIVSGHAGAPTAWPANWLFAARHGLPAARYDLLAGTDLNRDFASALDVGDPATDAAVLLGGWSVRHPCAQGVCREVEGRAAVALPVRDPRDVDLSVIAAGSGTLTVELNGVAVLAGALGDGLAPLSVRVPRARFRRGVNAMVLSVTAGGRAAVDRIAFAPVGGPA